MRPVQILSIFFLLATLQVSGKPLLLSEKELDSPPPRIIRTCCSFGSEVGMAVIPFMKFTDITSTGRLGNHHFLGDDTEGNGIIYSGRGGFIDLGHLRDQADWTAYLFALIRQQQDQGCIIQKLGNEGGEKVLKISVPAGASEADLLLLAGRIAYDLSVWHEIATWFGASYLPLIPERYSSFSVEDCYSNLLGVMLGMEALQSELPYEEAMTRLICKKLEELEAVSTEAATFEAMEAVRNIWWTRDKRLPSAKILLLRQTNVYATLTPSLIPGDHGTTPEPVALHVPERLPGGELLTDFYELEIRLNYKFPFRKMFPGEEDRIITQQNFDTLIRRVNQECRFRALRSNGENRAQIQEARKELKNKGRSQESHLRKNREFRKG